MTNKVLIGSFVTLPKDYTYEGRIFRVKDWSEKYGYTLEFLSGKNKEQPIEYFDNEDLILLNEKDILKLLEIN